MSDSKANRPKTFYTSKMSEASYLSEIKGVPVIEVYVNQDNQFRIVLDISYSDAKNMLLDWPGSSWQRFDKKIKDFKDILCCDNPPRKDER